MISRLLRPFGSTNTHAHTRLGSYDNSQPHSVPFFFFVFHFHQDESSQSSAAPTWRIYKPSSLVSPFTIRIYYYIYLIHGRLVGDFHSAGFEITFPA